MVSHKLYKWISTFIKYYQLIKFDNITYQLEFQEFDIPVVHHRLRLHYWEGMFAYLHKGLHVKFINIRLG